MKQVININFHGQVVPLEVTAFEILKKYTESLSVHFQNEEGKEEIINDIESRIAELFQARIKKGAACITDEDVNTIIKSMGRPEDFDLEDEKNTNNSSNPKMPNQENETNTKKRLFRNENEKVIAGVCSGIGNYFEIDPVIVRIAFILITMVFGAGLLAYIILWIATPSTTFKEINGSQKKLYRDTDDKIVAGICSGIANYFNINVWIPRAIFLLPLARFFFKILSLPFNGFPHFININLTPSTTLIYIILWLVIPEAITTTEKLQMKGERVDLNSIKNSVVEEMKEMQQKAEKFGAEAKTFTQEKGRVLGAELSTLTKKRGSSLGDIIVTLTKFAAYGFIGFVALILIITLFSVALGAMGIFPLKDFLLNNGWQNIFAWGTLLFFIAVPVVGIITWIIRRLIKSNGNKKLLRFSFVSMWVIGWASFMALIGSTALNFKSSNTVDELPLRLNNPTVASLELTNTSEIQQSKNYKTWHQAANIFNFGEEDTLYVSNVHCRIIQSPTDSFQVFITKICNGKNKNEALMFANQINYLPTQNNELLQMPMGIAIDKINKFRNQRVVITVAVPVGKKIKINQSIWDLPQGKINFSFDNINEDEYVGNEERGWTTNVQYIMEKDGLHKLNGEPIGHQNKIKIDVHGVEVNGKKNKITIDENGININGNTDNAKQQQLDSLEKNQEAEKDSLENLIEQKHQKEKDKLLHQTVQPVAYNNHKGYPIQIN